MEKIIEVKHLTKAYQDGKRKNGALADISFSLSQGKSMAILGPSGSGKTTLLHVLAGLEKPTAGDVEVAGRKITNLKEKELSKFRNETIGFVFQYFYLDEHLTVAENIALPLLLAGKTREQANRKVEDLLTRINMTHQRDLLPRQLTNSEMRRVAVARAWVKDPKLILVDDPTENLDYQSKQNILDLFDQIADSGISVVLITQDKYLTQRFENVLKLNKDGTKGKDRRS